MPSFDFSNIGGGGTSQNYGYIVDQLQMKEDQLAADGKLSPGDYKLLMSQAQAAYAHPGLTPAQRSNILVKISGYQKDAKVSTLKDTEDLTRLGNEVKDDFQKNSLIFGNNPTALLQSNADALRLKADQLSSAIDSLDNSGDDSSAHVNEYNQTLNDYQDMMVALDQAKNYKPGSEPAGDFAAYVTTNSKGEVVDVKVGRTGSQSGYLQTNGVYGGLPLWGKVNSKQGNKNTFKLGDSSFSAPDYLIPDPENPGAFKNNTLVSDDQKTGGAFKGAQGGQYKDINLATVRTQSAIPVGGWAQGSKGFLYKRTDDGKYVKYTNGDKDKLGIQDNQIINIPNSYEQSLIVPNVSQTVDASAPVDAPLPTSMAPATSTPPVSSTTTQPTAPQPSLSRTQAPVSRAPSGVLGIAESAISKAGGFLKNLFTGGK